MKHLRIASRSSPLALWQARKVKTLLQKSDPQLNIDIVAMSTSGDQLTRTPYTTAGNKGLFLKELETALVNNEVDIAVHSMKDVPIEMPDGLIIAAVCEREDARDVLISNHFTTLRDMPAGSRLGTSSLRRRTQIRHHHPQLQILPLRGNVNSRLQKLDNDQYSAIVLAAAGLIRLGLAHRISEFIDPGVCIPAIGQGIIGVECCIDNHAVKQLLATIHSPQSGMLLAAERALGTTLGGSCHLPVGGYARLFSKGLRLTACVADVDGQQLLRTELEKPLDNDESDIGKAQSLGKSVAEKLLGMGADSLLARQ